MKPSDVQPNAFSENLRDDEWVAVNATGQVIGRAGSEDGIKCANPTAEAWYSGKDLRDGNTARNPFDRDGDGKSGGAPKGGNQKAAAEQPNAQNAFHGPDTPTEDPAPPDLAPAPAKEPLPADTPVKEPVAEKSSGHKDDPGNTNRKASAGPHAKQPVHKK